MTGPVVTPLPPLKGRIALWTGAILMTLGVVLGGFLAVTGLFDVRDTVQSYQRIPASGGLIRISHPGRYTVFLEIPGVDQTAPGYEPDGLVVVSGPTGTLPISYSSTTTTYNFSGNSGVSVGTFRAPEAGDYRIAFVRQGGVQGAELAVGRADLSGFARIGIGAVLGGALFLVGLIALIIGAVRRSGSRRDRARAQGIVPGVWGAPGSTWAGAAAGPGAVPGPGGAAGWAAPPAPPTAWTGAGSPGQPGWGSPSAAGAPGPWPATPPAAPAADAPHVAPPPPPGPAGWPVPPSPHPISPLPPAPPVGSLPSAPPNQAPFDASPGAAAAVQPWDAPRGPRPAWPPAPPGVADGPAGPASAVDPTVPDPWHRVPEPSPEETSDDPRGSGAS